MLKTSKVIWQQPCLVRNLCKSIITTLIHYQHDFNLVQNLYFFFILFLDPKTGVVFAPVSYVFDEGHFDCQNPSFANSFCNYFYHLIRIGNLPVWDEINKLELIKVIMV